MRSGREGWKKFTFIIAVRFRVIYAGKEFDSFFIAMTVACIVSAVSMFLSGSGYSIQYHIRDLVLLSFGFMATGVLIILNNPELLTVFEAMSEKMASNFMLLYAMMILFFASFIPSSW